MEKKLERGEYTIIMETRLGVEGINDDFYSMIEIRKDSHCIQKYIEQSNGYLLIE